MSIDTIGSVEKREPSYVICGMDTDTMQSTIAAIRKAIYIELWLYKPKHRTLVINDDLLQVAKVFQDEWHRLLIDSGSISTYNLRKVIEILGITTEVFEFQKTA